MGDYFVHESAVVDEPAHIGAGSSIWHFSHIMSGAELGKSVNIGQNVFIAADVVIGSNVKIQNNVSLYSGVILEDGVFCGPSCVFTNIGNPRSEIVRKGKYEKTLIKRGASIGANATIVCGSTIGSYALIGAGAVVTKDVKDFALITGVPGIQSAWVSHYSHRLTETDADGNLVCPESGLRYKASDELICLDDPKL